MIGRSMHLTDESLTAVARGERTQGDAESVGVHLASCAQCRDRLQGIRSMLETLEALPAIVASDALWERIESRRASGERVLLDTSPIEEVRAAALEDSTDRESHRRPSAIQSATHPRTWLPLIGLAASVAIALVLWRPSSTGSKTASANSAEAPPRSVPVTPSASPLPKAGGDDGLFSVWPTMAYAQSAPRDTEATFPAIRDIDTTRLRNGTRFYVRSSASSYHDYMPIEAMSVSLTDTALRGERAWRVVTNKPLLSNHSSTDTAWLRRADLKLLARRYRSTSSIVSQRAIGDTVLEQRIEVLIPKGIAFPGDRKLLSNTSTTALHGDRTFVADQVSFMLLVRSLPLTATFRGSIDVSSERTPLIVRSPPSINVSVQGDSLVSTLWGHVPCWRVVLHTGANPERWYVSKENHEVLLVTGPNGMEWPRSRLDLIGRYVK